MLPSFRTQGLSPGSEFGRSRGSKGIERGAQTHLILASAKNVRKVERDGGTARPVAGRKMFTLDGNRDSILAVGFTRE